MTSDHHAARLAFELDRCRETVDDEPYRRLLTCLVTDPQRARDLLAPRLAMRWASLVAPHCVRIRALLDRDVEERFRALTRHGLRRVLDELHPKLRWTTPGPSLADRDDRTVHVDGRGLLLMPSAHLWLRVASTVEEPWLPAIIYPATGIAGLWQAPAAPRGALSRLLGRTRALVLSVLDQPISTTALAAVTELSPAGVSRHLLALRDAGIAGAARHGHGVRYRRTGRRSRPGQRLARRPPGAEIRADIRDSPDARPGRAVIVSTRLAPGVPDRGRGNLWLNGEDR